MAFLIRQTSRLLNRTVLLNSVRASSGRPKSFDPNDPYGSIDNEVRTNVEAFYQELRGEKTEEVTDEQFKELGSLTGAQRHEMLEKLRGVSDPFDVGVHKQTNDDQGSVQNPIIVPTCEGSRLVGCVCEEDMTEVTWMTIYNGTKRQCNCGNWFQCVQIPGAMGH